MRPVGRRGLLVDAASPPATATAVRTAAAAAGVALAEVVPGATTVLVVAAHQRDVAALRLAVDAAGSPPDNRRGTGQAGEPVVVPVRYDGDDLDAVASACAMSREAVVDAHVAGSYLVDFCGFAPGFAYLSGLPHPLHLPRRDRPRPRVPAGAVAIADRYAAVYPRSTPGGWHLIGRTDLAVWDTGRRPAALLAPGTAVRFTAVR